MIELKAAKAHVMANYPNDPLLRHIVINVLDTLPKVDVTDNNVGSKWIPVTERLPEQGQEVIVYDGGVLKPKVFCYLFWNKNYDSWARITHWMPLPEPPKEE